MKFLNFWVLALVLFCCGSNEKIKEVELTVLNETDVRLDSVLITTYDVNLKFVDVKPKQKIEKKTLWSYGGTYEGAFLVRIYAEDTLKTAGTFGYFANGGMVHPSYTLTIFDDFKYRESKFAPTN